MATGYTAKLYDQDISFNEFVWICARAFGALAHMRDETNNSAIKMPEPPTYHINRINELNLELARIKKMTPEEISALIDQEAEDNKHYHLNSIKEKEARKERYLKILEQVENWEPPSSQHLGLKQFMQEQLASSIDHDCDVKYHQIPLQEVKESVDSWLNDNINTINSDIAYHTKQAADDTQRYQEKLDWIKLLHNSVPIP